MSCLRTVLVICRAHAQVWLSLGLLSLVSSFSCRLFAEDDMPHRRIEIWRGREVSNPVSSRSTARGTDRDIGLQTSVGSNAPPASAAWLQRTPEARNVNSPPPPADTLDAHWVKRPKNYVNATGWLGNATSGTPTPGPFNAASIVRPLDVLVTKENEQAHLTSFRQSSLPSMDLDLAGSTNTGHTNGLIERADISQLLSATDADPNQRAEPTLEHLSKIGHPKLDTAIDTSSTTRAERWERHVPDSWNAATREVVASFLGFTVGLVVLVLSFPLIVRRFGDELRPVIRVELMNSTLGNESLAAAAATPTDQHKTSSNNRGRSGRIQGLKAGSVSIRPPGPTLADQQRGDQDQLRKTQLSMLEKILEQNADLRKRIHSAATEQ